MVTNLEPLRIYIYNEGIARFCAEAYSLTNLDNNFCHLTNYSINKTNSNFIMNKEVNNDGEGNKWSLSALNKYWEEHGIDLKLMWSKIYDIIIKSILSVEHILLQSSKKLETQGNNCFELFGYDILIDSELKPWIMEINMSPSLAIDSPLDFAVKSNLVKDILNIAGIHVFDRKREAVKNNNPQLTQSNFFPKNSSFAKPIKCKSKKREKSIDELKLVYKKIILESIEEYKRKGNFIRIYPMKGCNIYDKYFYKINKLNRILYSYLYDFKIISPSNNSITKFETQNSIEELKNITQDFNEKRIKINTVKSNFSKLTFDENNKNITSSNTFSTQHLLAEYISRIIFYLKNIENGNVKPPWKENLNKFIFNEFWKKEIKIDEKLSLREKLRIRLEELDNRNKTNQMILNGNIFQENLINSDVKKNENALSYIQIEKILSQSTESPLIELIKIIIPSQRSGILSYLINCIAESKRGVKNFLEDSNMLPLISHKDNFSDQNQTKILVFNPLSQTNYGKMLTKRKYCPHYNSTSKQIVNEFDPKYDFNKYMRDQKFRIRNSLSFNNGYCPNKKKSFDFSNKFNQLIKGERMASFLTEKYYAILSQGTQRYSRKFTEKTKVNIA